MHATFVTVLDVTSDSVTKSHCLSVGANACQSGYGISSVCVPHCTGRLSTHNVCVHCTPLPYQDGATPFMCVSKNEHVSVVEV